mgnify:CR=1 FL=1
MICPQGVSFFFFGKRIQGQWGPRFSPALRRLLRLLSLSSQQRRLYPRRQQRQQWREPNLRATEASGFTASPRQTLHHGWMGGSFYPTPSPKLFYQLDQNVPSFSWLWSSSKTELYSACDDTYHRLDTEKEPHFLTEVCII